MKIERIYKGENYYNVQKLRNEIFKDSGRIFGEEPKEGREEFWAELGVTYKETPDPEPTLEELKQRKLNQLEQSFLRWYETDATVVSSLGFTADSDARSMMDVSGIVTALESVPEESRSTVAFMDSSNEPHELTLDQVKTLQLEIIQNGQSAYQQKWSLRTAIESAENAEALEAIVTSFTGLDFSKVSE